jgi:hypothetical protein
MDMETTVIAMKTAIVTEDVIATAIVDMATAIRMEESERENSIPGKAVAIARSLPGVRIDDEVILAYS